MSEQPEWVELLRTDIQELSTCKDAVQSLDRAIRGFNGKPGLMTRITVVETTLGRLIATLALIGGAFLTGLIGWILSNLLGG